MQRIKELLSKWETVTKPCLTKSQFSIRLTVSDAARLMALSDLYPNFTCEEIVSDIISTALDEIETSLPYVQGKEVIAEDDFGDPIYEDVGPSATFHESSRRHSARLYAELQEAGIKS